LTFEVKRDGHHQLPHRVTPFLVTPQASLRMAGTKITVMDGN